MSDIICEISLLLKSEWLYAHEKRHIVKALSRNIDRLPELYDYYSTKVSVRRLDFVDDLISERMLQSLAAEHPTVF
jgi:hypothetical protein